MTATVLHLVGEVLVGPDDVRPEAWWVLGGRLTFERPSAAGADMQTLRGWVLPGLVDAHCHVGLDAHGAVDRETAEQQALGDRAAGTLLIRDAGSPSDTRWIDERDDLPKVIRAGRHIARTRRYIRNYAHEVEPEQLVERVRLEARAGDGWVKLVGDWIDRDAGDLMPCWPADVLKEAIAAAHEEGARVTAHCFGEASLHDFAAAGTDCIEHATGLEPPRSSSSRRRASRSCRRWSTSRPSLRSPSRHGRSSPRYHPTCWGSTGGATRPWRRARGRCAGLPRHRRGRLAARPGGLGGRGAGGGDAPAWRC